MVLLFDLLVCCFVSLLLACLECSTTNRQALPSPLTFEAWKPVASMVQVSDLLVAPFEALAQLQYSPNQRSRYWMVFCELVNPLRVRPNPRSQLKVLVSSEQAPMHSYSCFGELAQLGSELEAERDSCPLDFLDFPSFCLFEG